MNPKETPPVRHVVCPACGGASVYAPSNAFRPFCSERCRLTDLGQWASEGFRVAVEPTGESLEGDGPEAFEPPRPRPR